MKRMVLINFLLSVWFFSYGQKPIVKVGFTIAPSYIFSDYAGSIPDIQNVVSDSIVLTLNKVLPYADFNKGSSSNQLQIGLISKPNQDAEDEFTDLYFSVKLTTSTDPTPVNFVFLFADYETYNGFREDPKSLKRALAQKFREHFTENYDQGPISQFGQRLPMNINNQKHFTMDGLKYKITLPFDKKQLSIDTINSKFKILVNYANGFITEDSVRIIGHQRNNVFISPSKNLKGCLLLQSIKDAPGQGTSGTVFFSKYKRLIYPAPIKFGT